MNNKNATQLINHIIDNPAQWDQRHWHCDTTHCFAGHAQIMAGKELDSFMCKTDAQTWLELTSDEADWLFSYNRTLPELHRFVLMSVQGIEFDEDGFNEYGFNEYGFKKSGFNKYGFNEYGYDECGYDKDGFDKDGNKLPRIEVTQ